MPFFYVRQSEDGIKGQMYADLGVGDWAPEIEETTPEALASLVLKTLADQDKARTRAKAAAAKAQQLEAQGLKTVRNVLGLA